ncbi:site-specific integrase [Natribaculum luteum]|uniref:Site-specific integrase n=1 Tax=Natribaculum luteum TaxID=1586232 RepID=A0ABD5NVY4_9EURY|nr:site-specific integrase [Natribaculum luteum]
MKDYNEPTILTNPTKKMLNAREQKLYRKHREKLIRWLANCGKDLDKFEGYSGRTVKMTADRLDMFYRWVWQNQTNGFTIDITHDHADAYVDYLRKYKDSSTSDKKKHVMCVKRLFKWRHDEHDGDLWKPDVTFTTTNSNPQDYLDREERRKIRSASLKHGEVPELEDIEPGELDYWKQVLAQRLGKPKHEISSDDWGDANSWKIPSLVWVSLDAGLRPAEVEKASTSWFRPQKAVLQIPKNDAVKSRDNWEVALRHDTAEVLEAWLEEREQIEAYNDTDRIWLNREGNPYQSASLIGVINRVADTAGIETKNRSLSWYSIRYSITSRRLEPLATAF